MPLHRRVFFIAGFDPKSPRYYHHLYRDLAAQRPAGAEGADGPATLVSGRRRLNDWADEWDVDWPQGDGAPLHTRYTVLRWDDLVRTHWPRSATTVLRDHWNFYVDGARQGFFRLAWRTSRLNWVFVTYPLWIALALIVLWVSVAAALGALLYARWGPAAAMVVAIASAGAAWWSWRRLSHRLGSDWLMRLYGFSHAQAAGRIPGLDARIDSMAELIVSAFDEATNESEVLVVGHSTGATLAASALARALTRSPRLGQHGPQLSLLTLGHCIPLVSYFPTAHALRAELDALTAHPQLTWVDYTAPADWAGCGRISPWFHDGRAVLHRLSPRFPKILEPTHYQALRRNRLAMHMQYLKPADRAGHYDLLVLTAGRQTLRERHPPAPSSAT
ncbi:MAG TPA: hypothetical protein VGQ91_12455 [Ideonella sp.]|nr:hypothetical protein [Ideonella sp.]